MPKQISQETERLANRFVSYLFDEYQGTKHVRRVATWIGFVLKGIENLSELTIRRSHARQIVFEYGGHKFKARYNHKVGPRGGIEIVEVLRGRGSPEGDVVLQITNLSEAEGAYLSLEESLDAFIDKKDKG